MNPTVSVIVAAYNCEHFVAQSLSSLLDQTYIELEILISDDCSTDGTRQVIDGLNDERIRRFHNDINLGYLRTANKLLEQATGDYICFQDADDWCTPERVECQVRALQNGSLGACGTGIYYTNQAGDITETIIYPGDREVVKQSELAGKQSASYGSVLFTRAVYRKIGGYREFFSYGAEDHDWFMRLVQSFDYDNIPECHYFYRFCPTSITSSLSILKQKASRYVSLDLAQERESLGVDSLDLGDVEKVQNKWNELYQRLGSHPLAEEINKANRLLRRHALKESFVLMKTVSLGSTSLQNKVGFVFLTTLKICIGMKRYEQYKKRLNSWYRIMLGPCAVKG